MLRNNLISKLTAVGMHLNSIPLGFPKKTQKTFSQTTFNFFGIIKSKKTLIASPPINFHLLIELASYTTLFGTIVLVIPYKRRNLKEFSGYYDL